MISCKQAARLLSEAQDHPLPLHKKMLLQAHLVLCTMCRRYEKQLQWLREALAQDQAVEASIPEPPRDSAELETISDVEAELREFQSAGRPTAPPHTSSEINGKATLPADARERIRRALKEHSG